MKGLLWVNKPHTTARQAERSEIKAAEPVSPDCPVISSAFKCQAKCRVFKAGTWGFCNSCTTIVWRPEERVIGSNWRSERTFGGGVIVLWWGGHLEKLKTWGWGGKRDMKGRATPLVGCPHPLGRQRSRASWTCVLQRQALPLPPQNPTTRDWWELVKIHPNSLHSQVETTLKWLLHSFPELPSRNET